jgi:hypothetical protein
MTWRNFGKILALALIGQAVVRTALTDAPTNLFWSGIAIAVQGQRMKDLGHIYNKIMTSLTTGSILVIRTESLSLM